MVDEGGAKVQLTGTKTTMMVCTQTVYCFATRDETQGICVCAAVIPIIPVLEEEAEEESLATVASAPVVCLSWLYPMLTITFFYRCVCDIHQEQRSLPTVRQLSGALIHSIPTSTVGFKQSCCPLGTLEPHLEY